MEKDHEKGGRSMESGRVHFQRIIGTAGAVLALCAGARTVTAQIGSEGIDWVTIGSPNNPAYHRDDPQGFVTGRGSVPYEYRMGKYEVTTAQWLEFYNTFKARADAVSDTILPLPIIWGAGVDPTYGGPGRRYRLDQSDPNAGMRFTSGITWRVGAMFCNWLCNDKSSSLTAIQNGAYDTSTFQGTIQTHFTDQATRNPGARYWIPSLDEAIKASFFDSNANGGQGQWWLYPLGSDTQPIYAPPPIMGGNGQANAFFQLPGMAQYRIPLGSYQNSLTPWGLLDAAGGTSEWTEEWFVDGLGRTSRELFGSAAPGGGTDLIYGPGTEFPSQRTSYIGLRIASDVPSPSSCLILTGALCWGAVNTRRRSKTCVKDLPP
jgi:hypothetical protein